jgi:hypothetical protein
VCDPVRRTLRTFLWTMSRAQGFTSCSPLSRQLHNALHIWPTRALTEKRRRVMCGGKPIETLTLLDAFATTLIPKDLSNFFNRAELKILMP